MSKGTFYITTPIYYTSDNLHIGNAYNAVATDVMARYKRMRGYDVMFLTGTDEHGEKVEEKARNAGLTPKDFIDRLVAGIHELWALLNISYDRFIRTTDDYHVTAIQRIFKAMYDKGAIYKGTYRGLYCTPCESYWTESQLVDGKCPDCSRDVHEMEEEAYFFRLSDYTQKILDLYERQPDFLEPKSRMNEMVNNFLKPGLDDLCVTRTSVKWGIPVDFDPDHVVYVWIDALFNYMTALGYMNDARDGLNKYWPADVHCVGKEIVRFHAVIWPAMLMSLDLPLPKKVFGHGWLIFDGEKISKSKDSYINPFVLVEKYGVDALRYSLLRDITFGSDGDFTTDRVTARVNSDLANDFGNLIARTVAMVDKYFGGTLPDTPVVVEPVDNELITLANATPEQYAAQMDRLAYNAALAEVMKLSSRANKYIDETTPWTLAKDDANNPRLASVLYNLLETVRICTVMLRPFMPDSTEKIFAQIGAGEQTDWDTLAFGGLPRNARIEKGAVLFPRIETKE